MPTSLWALYVIRKTNRTAIEYFAYISALTQRDLHTLHVDIPNTQAAPKKKSSRDTSLSSALSFTSSVGDSLHQSKPQSKRIKKLKSFRFVTLNSSNRNKKKTVKEHQLQLEKFKWRQWKRERGKRTREWARWQVKVNKVNKIRSSCCSSTRNQDATESGWEYGTLCKEWHPYFSQILTTVLRA